jgi:hypothetical protein
MGKRMGKEVKKLTSDRVPIDTDAFSTYYSIVIARDEINAELNYMCGLKNHQLFEKLITHTKEGLQQMDNNLINSKERIVALRQDTGSKNHARLQQLFVICDEMDYIVACLTELSYRM